MTIAATGEEIAAAQAYQDLHVPALFAQWAPLLTKLARIAPGCRVLDVACGTGILAREAARQAGTTGYVAGVDPSPGMLSVARNLEPSVDWIQGLAEALPQEDESFDAVVSQFGLMFFTDRVAAIAEMLRVLVPGGRVAVAVWDSLENSAAYPIVVELLDRRAGSAAADALRAPFALGNSDALQRIFAAAGAASIKVVSHQGRARFPSVRAMVEADLRGWLPVMGVNLPEDLIETILADAESALARYVRPDGRAEFAAPARIVTATRPADG